MASGAPFSETETAVVLDALYSADDLIALSQTALGYSADAMEAAANGFFAAAASPGAPDLSRDDAQARALLGCGTVWPPGTVDALLAEAYAALVEEWRAQGLCSN